MHLSFLTSHNLLFFRFCKTSKKTTFSVFLSFFIVKSPKSQSLKLNISRTAWPILMILVSFCRILNGRSDKINLFWRCSSPLKNDCSLFSRLYIACQAREGNLEEFLRHENQPFPPSLSVSGKLRHGKKSELIDFLQTALQHTSQWLTSRQSMELQLCTFSLPRLLTKPFKIMQTKLLPFVRKEIENVKRLDTVWDRYVENSLKDDPRESRGQGIRKRDVSTSSIPINWHSFFEIERE